MRSVLVAINAKYIHTNPAVRAMAELCKAEGLDVAVQEYTVNQSPGFILRGLAEAGADCYLFSAYLWNVSLVSSIGDSLRQLLPGAFLAAGGPEVSYRARDFLTSNPAFRAVLQGEGERSVPALLHSLEREAGLEGCPGVAWRNGGSIRQNAGAPLPDLDALPFPYPDLDALEGRILYYESSRGCPFSCSYCLSSVERGVRLRSLPLVFAHLDRFLAAGVPQVKFVDRTFNCGKSRALSIWAYLRDHDNGQTNFHFELAGDLLDDEALELLSTIRPGQFQFEIGVQSTNVKTLSAISRPARTVNLFKRVAQLRRMGNIHLHLDLIAGLPHEDFASFARSFNDVFGLGPQQFQLGFLKVLSGSAMERQAEEWGLRYRRDPPYQILFNRWISYGELEELSGIADLVDLYYNSGRFRQILLDLVSRFPTPFDCFRSLYRFYREAGCEETPLSKTGQYELLGRFFHHCGFPQDVGAKWRCKFDILSHEKPRRLPDWVDVDLSASWRERIRAFFAREENIRAFLPGYVGRDPKQISRMVHLEAFPLHPLNNREGAVLALFDYQKRDASGHAAVTWLEDIGRDGSARRLSDTDRDCQ